METTTRVNLRSLKKEILEKHLALSSAEDECKNFEEQVKALRGEIKRLTALLPDDEQRNVPPAEWAA